MRIALPRVYLGTMTFGWSGQTSSYVDEPVALEMAKLFIQKNPGSDGQHHLDTARIYAGGKTEPICGGVLKSLKEHNNGDDENTVIVVGTKAHPSQKDGLSASGIRQQFQESIDAMGIDKVTEFYLHQPDTENSLVESLTCAHQLVQEGKIEVIGMSNYHVDEMARAFEICRQHGLTKPTVYQGLYNPLNRLVEKELLPLLKENQCSFIAYNPLAAGLLAGKHKSKDVVMDGRFKNNPNYLPRFYTDDNFSALNRLREACKDEGISLLEATYRWLLRHSCLSTSNKDGVLLGASSIEQLNENLDACNAAADKGPLSDNLLQKFDEVWKITEKSAFPYWRSYSSDMPNWENLDQGASYSATKK